ncbi:MAG: TIGR03936 family radical SAM-associated protein [Anaerolineales bacterium]|jgi:radical SAM-linked protein|nr:TIGR03936 family radical SAM-associated protein [Anaerolineales bacterium]
MTVRIRITFAKQGALRYIGHLDLHKLWESATRRAGIGLAYSQGFHPQPKIQLASALPLGFSSRCEVADLWLDNDSATAELASFQTRLQAALPAGIVVRQIAQVDERAPALQTQVTAAEFEVTLPDEVDADALSLRLAALLEADSLLRERRGKTYDLRPLIESLAFCACPAPALQMRLTAREGATGRPEEVLAALEIPIEDTRIERTKLIFA